MNDVAADRAYLHGCENEVESVTYHANPVTYDSVVLGVEEFYCP